MQNLQDTYEKIFSEIKILLSELSESDSYKVILNKENEINQLYQKFSFLKISQNVDYPLSQIQPLEVIDNQRTNIGSDLISVEEFEQENKVAEVVIEEKELHDIFEDVPEVEEVHSFAEIDAQENWVDESMSENEIVDEEISRADATVNETEIGTQNVDRAEELSFETEVVNEVEAQSFHEEIVEVVTEIEEEEENLLEEPAEKLEPMQDSQFSFAMTKDEATAENSQDDYETRLAEKEAKLKELEENRRKIVEFSKENTQPKEKSQEVYESNPEDNHDKKFKLANIKGLKIAKSLFDDDHLEQEEKSAPVQTSGSLLKNNVPTDYMEAPKPKPEFKLDLNDRIAFSQYLFNGSQSELNQVVTVLNSFSSLEKAQEYLSDIYYDRDWKKVDNYAQRLWTLVENRFL